MRLAAAVMVAVLVAGCGSAVPSAAATPSPAVTPMPAPSGWTYLPWYDPDLELAVPAGWEPTIKFETWSPDPSVAPDVQAGAAWWNGKIRSGVLRMQATMLADAGDGSTLDMLVMVESGDASLAAFVDRSVKELATTKEVARHDADFAMGHAIVVDYVSEGSDHSGIARDYLFRLVDGRSLTVEVSDTRAVGASPAPDATSLATLGDQIVATLRPHQ